MDTLALDADIDALMSYGAACIRVARHDKAPLGRAWNTLATTVADVIAEWLGQGYNVGLLCGAGNLIDIEYDDDAGCEFFQQMQTVPGVPFTELETPCWTSQRGQHHLFRLADPLPQRGWVKRGGLEIRLGGKPAQSVLPPSVHPSGRRYSWLVSPSQCAPATITLADLGLCG